MMGRLDEAVKKANAELSAMTEGGYPYSFKEVALSMDSDAAAIYIRSGNTPVYAFVRKGNPERGMEIATKEISDIVAATRATIERRKAVKAEADEMKAADGKFEAAAKVLRDAGLDDSVLKGGIDRDARKAVLKAVAASVARANRFPYIGLTDYHDFRMRVRAFPSGLVVEVGGKPVLVTRFPKAGGPKALERTILFLQNDIDGIDASRRRYFEEVREKAEREERLREAARQFEAADERLWAAM